MSDDEREDDRSLPYVSSNPNQNPGFSPSSAFQSWQSPPGKKVLKIATIGRASLTPEPAFNTSVIQEYGGQYYGKEICELYDKNGIGGKRVNLEEIVETFFNNNKEGDPEIDVYNVINKARQTNEVLLRETAKTRLVSKHGSVHQKFRNDCEKELKDGLNGKMNTSSISNKLTKYTNSKWILLVIIGQLVRLYIVCGGKIDYENEDLKKEMEKMKALVYEIKELFSGIANNCRKETEDLGDSVKNYINGSAAFHRIEDIPLFMEIMSSCLGLNSLGKKENPKEVGHTDSHSTEEVEADKAAATSTTPRVTEGSSHSAGISGDSLEHDGEEGDKKVPSSRISGVCGKRVDRGGKERGS